MAASREYRRRRGAEAQPWHFCTNCRAWPTANFDRTVARPSGLCAECQALERRQMCTSHDPTYL